LQGCVEYRPATGRPYRRGHGTSCVRQPSRKLRRLVEMGHSSLFVSIKYGIGANRNVDEWDMTVSATAIVQRLPSATFWRNNSMPLD